MRSWPRVVALVVGPSVLAVLAASVGGCGDDEPTFEVVPLEGKVEKIEVKPDGSGRITVSYYSEKHKQEIAGTGTVTRETEIMINGAAASLRDIREGEQVHGEVRVEKKGKEKKQIALRIYVDRAK
ncbi:MAG: hypothetical protein HY763_03550 [Planctomycetes bacterium]|nr:hypothetical protein [Planctomycetota bacterium]